MAKPTKIEQALFDVTTIPSDSMELDVKIDVVSSDIVSDDGSIGDSISSIPVSSTDNTDKVSDEKDAQISAPIDDGEWIIETNYRGEIVNSYPKARNAGK